MASIYKSGTQWVVVGEAKYTLDSGSCISVESADGTYLQIRLKATMESIMYAKYVLITDAAGTAYTKDEVLTLLQDFLRPPVGVPGGCVAVTPHNTNLLPHIGWIEVRGTAGNVAFIDAYGNASLVLAFDTKEMSKMLVKQVLATGTTATDIYLYY